MKEISSTTNKLVKHWKKLNSKRGRSKAETYLIEGYHLVEEAILNQAKIQSIMISKPEDQEIYQSFDESLYLISNDIKKELAETETSQGVFAEIAFPQPPNFQAIKSPYLLLDGIQDPGNLGTLIRTADACGIKNIVASLDTVDFYNDKVLRSGQGSHFHVHLHSEDLVDFIPRLKEAGLKVFGTLLDERALPYRKLGPMVNFAFIVGNEGRGLSKPVLNLTDENVYIPMKGQAESLNVAVAAGIIMFHLYQ